jgi:hypothetical protein
MDATTAALSILYVRLQASARLSPSEKRSREYRTQGLDIQLAYR